MKTKLSALGALFLCACAAGATIDGVEVDEAEVKALSLPEPGARAGEYRARQATLRLFGVQGVGTVEASATLADTRTWATSDHRVGDVLGRNLRITRIEESGVELAGGAAPIRLGIGQDVTVRLIEHDYDRAVSYQGAHRYAVQAAVLQRIIDRRGVGASGEEIDIAGERAVRLSAVAPGSALSRLGLREGDRLHRVDGRQAEVADVGRVAARLAAGEAVVLAVGRGHAAWEARYEAN